MKLMLLGTIALLASGCGQDEPPPPPDQAATESQPVPDPTDMNAQSGSPPVSNERVVTLMLGEKVARAQWRKAANRGSCAPIALKSDAKAGGFPRPATYSGGWAVAFDQPNRRSAYGFAGSGLTPDDRADFAILVDRLTSQWPHVRRWDAGDNLPAGSEAGYGLEGAKDYPAGSSGFDQQSLAYLRIPGQACLYNVWSKLGRNHLELMMGELVVLKP